MQVLYHGVELLDYFRLRRPWRQLRMFIDRLPSMGGSHFIAARRADPDLAERMLELQEEQERAGRKPRPPNPPDAEWTQDHELLTQILDMLGALIAVEASHPLPKGVKPRKPPPPRARPQRGVDTARARRRNRYLAELEDDVTAAQARWVAQNRELSTMDNSPI